MTVMIKKRISNIGDNSIPDSSKDLHIGRAVLRYSDKKNGWVMPGGKIIHSPVIANHIAIKMSRIIQGKA